MKNMRVLFLLLPALVIMFLIAVVPLITVFNYSLLDLFAGTFAEPVGWQNYVSALRDPAFMSSIKKQFLFTFIVILIEIPLGIGLAFTLPKQKTSWSVIASITGKRGDNTTLPVYGASKGGIITLTRSIARELGPYGITCNAIAPHAIMTKMMSYWDEEKKKKTAEVIPVKRLGTVEDVSNLIMFLASDKASFITGETININGGYYMD
jgi:NAD(P)-dependent dehydrogenase (short-subunit alcohol dehydrogenase family)